MLRRVSISALLLTLVLSSTLSTRAASATEELTLHAGGRTAVRPLTRLADLALALDLPAYDSTEEEPNDTLATAMRIAVPARTQGTAAFGDPATIRVEYADGVIGGIADVFTFTIEESRALAVDLTWTGTDADLDLFLFEQIGGRLHVIEASARADAAAETLTAAMLQPGTYYVGVVAFRGATTYDLALSGVTSSATCTEDTTTMCLGNGRFRVRATWSTSSGSGNAGAVPLTSDTGLLWFFSNGNVELIVKVLDGCPVNGRFWVFAGGLTDVTVNMVVTDTLTGATKQYTNAGGAPFRSVTDTDAFATCGASSCTYVIAPTSRSFGSGGGTGSFGVTTQPGCNWNAVSNASWINVTSGSSGGGNGTVSYTVAANGSNSARTGTISAAGHTHTVTQSGAGETNYNGTWSGMTSQPGKTISFVVSNNLITTVTLSYTATGTCTVNGTTTTNYNPGRPISGNTFTLTGSGPASFTINGSFASSTSASGSLSLTFSQAFPPCSASATASWTAAR